MVIPAVPGTLATTASAAACARGFTFPALLLMRATPLAALAAGGGAAAGGGGGRRRGRGRRGGCGLLRPGGGQPLTHEDPVGVAADDVDVALVQIARRLTVGGGDCRDRVAGPDRVVAHGGGVAAVGVRVDGLDRRGGGGRPFGGGGRGGGGGPPRGAGGAAP